jgi:hypothetical protein
MVSFVAQSFELLPVTLNGNPPAICQADKGIRTPIYELFLDILTQPALQTDQSLIAFLSSFIDRTSKK